MAEGSPIRIVLLEDHTLLREVLARTLAAEQDFEVVGQFDGVEPALKMVIHSPVDVVLLDINLGAEQGGSFLNRARASGYQGKVLVVTAGVSNREAAWLVRRGCSGIFLKSEPATALVERIRAVVRGDVHDLPTPPEVPPHSGSSEAGRKPLTRRECKVLRAVCEGLSNKQIAERLIVSENTVKSFLQQLFEKVGVRTQAQLVAAAIERYWDELGHE